MEQTGLIWIDWCIIGLIFLSGAISLWRGFFRECLSVIIWIIAVIVAWLFADQLSSVFANVISSYPVRFAIAVIILAVMVLVMGALVSFLISKLITATGLSGSDRLLGVIFGIIRGVVVTTILVGVLVSMPVHNTSWWQSSVLIPKFEQVAAWSQEVVINRIGPMLKNVPETVNGSVDTHQEWDGS